MKAVIQMVCDTPERWAQVNPRLLTGVLAVEETRNPDNVVTRRRYKIGDNVRRWAQLPYINGDEITFESTFISM